MLNPCSFLLPTLADTSNNTTLNSNQSLPGGADGASNVNRAPIAGAGGIALFTVWQGATIPRVSVFIPTTGYQMYQSVHTDPHLYQQSTEQQQPQQQSTAHSATNVGAVSTPSAGRAAAARRASLHRRTNPNTCLSCKESHVACDGKRPCNRCHRLSRPCVDAQRKKPGRLRTV